MNGMNCGGNMTPGTTCGGSQGEEKKEMKKEGCDGKQACSGEQKCSGDQKA